MRKSVSYCRRRVFLSLRSNSARVTNLPIILKVLGDPTHPVGGNCLQDPYGNRRLRIQCGAKVDWNECESRDRDLCSAKLGFLSSQDGLAMRVAFRHRSKGLLCVLHGKDLTNFW